MVSTREIQKLVGQLFLVGFDGHSVPSEFKKAIQKFNIGGTIFFKRNVHSPEQLAELSNEIQFDCRTHDMPFLFIAIDHEGGLVNRLSEPFTKFPSLDHLGEIGSPKVGYDLGMIMAKELKAVGININFTPVVDVNTNSKSPIIKSRAFSGDPEVCGRLGSAVARGTQKMGVMAVAKHFPGHGDTGEDSHFELPKLSKTYEELDKLELIPFKRIFRSRVDGVMTAHILNDALDPKYPATMSEFTLKEILRNRLRFSKIIFSDDMEMKAITKHYGKEEAAVLAVKAGCDNLIYRGDEGFPESCFDAIVKAVELGVINLAELRASNLRIASAKKIYANLTEPVDVASVRQFIGLEEHKALAQMIESKNVPKSYLESVPREF